MITTTTTSSKDTAGPRRLAARTLTTLTALAILAAAACGGGDGPASPGNGNKPPVDSTVAEPSVEARALWLSRYDYSTRAGLEALIDSAAVANFNLIYFQARGNGDAWYTPGLEPWGRQLAGTLGANPGWDPLQVAIDRAHAKGLELHAWINVAPGWVEDATTHLPLAMPETSPRHAFLAHPEWIMRDTVSASGKRLVDGNYELFSPAAAGYRTHVARVAADIVRRYAVDGIHLDYIRYPYQEWWDKVSFDNWTAAGRTQTWDDYRRAAVTDIVKQVFDSMKIVHPAARLSAATWGLYKNPALWAGVATGYDGRLQDARGWANQGIIDALVPMVYWPIKPTYGQSLDFAYLADDHVRNNPNGRHTYIGLDIENDALSTNGALMVKEINRARYAGAIGISVFSAQILQTNNWWHILPQTVFKKKATLPTMSWKP